MRNTIRSLSKGGDDDVPAPQSPFQSYRERRMEKVEEENKKRTTRARDTVISTRRK